MLTGERFREYLSVKLVSVLLIPVYIFTAPTGMGMVAVVNGGLRLAIAAALLWIAVSRHQLQYPWRSIRIVMAAGATTLILAAVEPLWPQHLVVRMVLSFVLGSAVMVLFLHVFESFDDEDRRLILASGLPFARVLVRML